MLVALSDQLAAGGEATPSVRTSAGLVRNLRESVGCVGGVAFYTLATMYYLVF